MTITSTPGRTEPKKPSEPEGPDAHGDRRPVPPPDPSRRNGAVLVGFTAVTNLADGVMRLALPSSRSASPTPPPSSPRPHSP